MSIERWEVLCVRGRTYCIPGNLFSKLGYDGWEPLTIHVAPTSNNAAYPDNHTTAYFRRRVSEQYERSRSQWIEWLNKESEKGTRKYSDGRDFIGL